MLERQVHRKALECFKDGTSWLPFTNRVSQSRSGVSEHWAGMQRVSLQALRVGKPPSPHTVTDLRVMCLSWS